MRSIDEIYGEMTAIFEKETGIALAGDGDMAVRLYAVAAQIYALYIQADWVNRQCFPQSAEGEYLDKHAQLRAWNAVRPWRRRGPFVSRRTAPPRPI